MPRCEGTPTGPCPLKKNDASVKNTPADLMCCPECTEVRFPTNKDVKTNSPEKSTKNTEKRTRKKCICNTTNRNKFMIRCDWCTVWYHGDCVSVKEGDYKRGEKYKCDECKDEKRANGVDGDEAKKKEAENELDNTNQSSKTMTTALLKLNDELEMQKQELQSTHIKLEEEKEKNKQQQEDNRKLKLEIGKLKVIIKGKEDDNKELVEEVTKLQRDIGIARNEIEMMEIKTKELQSNDGETANNTQ